MAQNFGNRRNGQTARLTAQLEASTASLRSFLHAQLGPRTSKGGAHLKTAVKRCPAVKSCGERFPGAPALAPEAGQWGGAQGSGHGQTTPLASQLHLLASRAGPVLKELSGPAAGAWRPAKARYNLASEEVAKRARTAPDVFVTGERKLGRVS